MRQVLKLAGTRVDIEIAKGTTLTIKLKFTNQSGQPVDLTNYTIKADVRRVPTSSTPIVTFSVTKSDNVAILSLSPEQTMSLTAGPDLEHPQSKHFYAVEIIRPDGSVFSPIYGELRVRVKGFIGQ